MFYNIWQYLQKHFRTLLHEMIYYWKSTIHTVNEGINIQQQLSQPVLKYSTTVIPGPVLKYSTTVIPGPVLKYSTTVIPGPVLKYSTTVIPGPVLKYSTTVIPGPVLKYSTTVIPGPVLKYSTTVIPGPVLKYSTTVIPGPVLISRITNKPKQYTILQFTNITKFIIQPCQPIKTWSLNLCRSKLYGLQFYFIFDLGFPARQDYFINFEPSQSVGGAKTWDPQEKPPDHPKQYLACLTYDPS